MVNAEVQRPEDAGRTTGRILACGRGPFETVAERRPTAVTR